MGVTIQQIADEAGVSRGTVDRALNGRGRIRPEVEEKIFQIAEELGYVQKTRKRTAPSRTEKLRIGVVTQLSRASFMLEIHRGITQAEKELGERGVELIRKEVESVEASDQLAAINELLREGIHGLALMPVDHEAVRAKLNWMTDEKNIPVVTFNSDIVGTRRSCFVGMDNRRSGQAAAGLLGMLTRGTGKILVITGHFTSLLNNLRVDGFIEELKRSYPGAEIAGVQCSFNEEAEVERIIETSLMNVAGINGILVISGGQEGIGRAFEKLGLDQRPYVVIYDQTPKNIRIMEEGGADFLIDQDGFTQGYRPPYILMNILRRGLEPKKELQYTDINIKTKYNL